MQLSHVTSDENRYSSQEIPFKSNLKTRKRTYRDRNQKAVPLIDIAERK